MPAGIPVNGVCDVVRWLRFYLLIGLLKVANDVVLSLTSLSGVGAKDGGFNFRVVPVLKASAVMANPVIEEMVLTLNHVIGIGNLNASFVSIEIFYSCSEVVVGLCSHFVSSEVFTSASWLSWGCCAAWYDKSLPTFQRDLMPPSSGNHGSTTQKTAICILITLFICP